MPVETAQQASKPMLVEGFIENPYPLYRQFLSEGPMHKIAIGPGFQSVFSYELVSSLLKDQRFSAKRTHTMLHAIPESERARFEPLVKTMGLWLLFMDAPEHSRLRKLMNKGFTPSVTERLRPRIEALVDRMLDGLEGRDELELMHDFAHPFPAKVIAELLDIPDGMHDDLIRWSDAVGVFLGNPRRTIEQCEAAQTALEGLTTFFRSAVAERRLRPGTDLISLLLEIEADGEVLAEEELYAQCVMLLFAGHETTRNLIGNGVYTLVQHPGELAKLREEPGLIRSGVEEMLRYQSPVQLVSRSAREDMELEGVTLRAGEQVLFVLGAANRDEDQFTAADTFDLARAKNPHLAFGAGVHFCIGNQIARLEAQTAILKLVQRFPKLKFTSQEPKWSPVYSLRGFSALPLQLK